MTLFGLDLSSLAGVFVGLAGFYLTASILYNVYFHPLASYPGPFWWRASRIPFCIELLRGTLSYKVAELHMSYGDVIRVAPNELSFNIVDAWKDIHGHRTQGEPELEKYEPFYRPVPSVPTNVINCPREEHTMVRRQLSNGFSDRSMREQQPLIMKYIDLLMVRLREQGKSGAQAVDMASWFNFTTFDVIGDLVFGEPFGCLSESDYHPWVKAIFQMGRVGVAIQTASHYPIIKRALLSLVPEKARREREAHLEFTKANLRRRLSLGQTRPDLISGLIKKDIDLDKLEANSSILIMAGSETTATLLSGVTYFLMTNPDTLEKLTDEIRSARHFKGPFAYHPERWLDDGAFASDNKDALQPFHIGPRNCLGRNLAYVEMRIIMARLLWNFDLKIAEESRSWLDQKIYLFWEKGPLYAYLTPAKR
ncbi:hypothetical protein ACJ41O_013171 [Fusarium nematophilum]